MSQRGHTVNRLVAKQCKADGEIGKVGRSAHFARFTMIGGATLVNDFSPRMCFRTNLNLVILLFVGMILLEFNTRCYGS